MSQKSGRRSRRPTTEEETTEFKTPTSKTNGENGEEAIIEEKPNENGSSSEVNGKETCENENGRVTRSRSQTPQKKKPENVNGNNEENVNGNNHHQEEEENVTEETESPEPEMDPLVVVDEPEPELIFEENSDRESGKESPILNRCQTRRSSSQNNSTPQTPSKDVSFESFSENLSTKVEVGGDSTRLEYADKDFSLESNSFLVANKNKTFAESLRHLSTRKSIRPISEPYRRALKNNMEKSETDGTYNLKRKHCNGSEIEAKRIKTDSPRFFARFTSPLASFRKNNLKPDIVSSTPKLTGYKDDKFLLENENESKVCEVQAGEKRWCSIM